MRVRRILFIVLLGVVLVFISFVFKQVETDLKTAISGLGVFGLVIYLVYTAISVTIISLPTFPLWPLAIITFGYLPAVLLTVAGSVIGASINFYLARRYGESIVKGLIGDKKYKEMQGFMGIENPKRFLIMRLFGQSVFDLLSYFAGFSKLKFRHFLPITSIVILGWYLIGFSIIDKTLQMPPLIMGLVFLISYLNTFIVALALVEINKRKNKKAFI